MTEDVTSKQDKIFAAGRQPLLEAKGISKAFGHVQALDNVDFELYPAEVVALIGDNGAGKSTLVKILSGIYRKDSGQLFFEGQPIELRGPKDAERLAGISTVYQDLALVDVRDVGSNIFLNMEPTRLGFFIDFKKMYANARQVIEVLRIDMPSVKVNVAELSGGQRQGVAISRALARGRRIFMLDEPTAALGVEQQHKVNELIANLKREGKTVLVISHNLEHVFTVADRLIILRRGKRVGTRLKSETTKEEIVGLITGAVRGDAVD
jgi:D-xylose transport system ATP-binding protein